MKESDPRLEEIKRLRIEGGLTYRALARRAGYRRESVVNWLKGENAPKDKSAFDELLRVAKEAAEASKQTSLDHTGREDTVVEIERLRREVGLSYIALGKLAGQPWQNVKNWLQGVHAPRIGEALESLLAVMRRAAENPENALVREIDHLRKVAGLTHGDLAKKFGTSKQNFGSWLRGNYQPRNKRVLDVALALVRKEAEAAQSKGINFNPEFTKSPMRIGPDPRAEEAERLRVAKGLSYGFLARHTAHSTENVYGWLRGIRNPRDEEVFDELLAVARDAADAGTGRQAKAAKVAEIDRVRKAAGLTFTSLSQLCGLSKVNVRNWLSGTHEPKSEEDLEKLLAAAKRATEGVIGQSRK